MNALSPEGLRQRARVLAAVRAWFADHGYLEVQTPVLVPSPAMEPHLYALPCEDGFLRTSPEFALKRVVSAGLPRVYELGPCFRGRESGLWHGREFAMLEWYRVGAGLDDLMDEVEGIVASAAAALGRTETFSWRRTQVRTLFSEAGIDLATATVSELSSRDSTWDDAFFRRWLDRIEPTLTDPVFVSDWPASQAALAQVRTDGDWPVAQRFEAYLGGVELANAFLELNQREAQELRIAEAAATRTSIGETPHPVDAAFVEAVGRLPTTAGIALGIDRLVAVLCGWPGIEPGRIPVF